MNRIAIPPILLLFACGGEDSGGTPATPGDTRPVGEDTTVSVFDSEYVYFGAENRREVDVEVALPDADATYEKIIGRFKLRCPNDRCDWWDRYGTFGIVLDAGTDDARYVEVDRFITAYRVGFSWRSDLTALRPLLTGTQTMRVFIDTWVGEGHENGDGWLFDAELEFVGGPAPSPEPVAVMPVWPHLSWRAGLPEEPVETQVPPTTVAIPGDLTGVTLRSFITGHGWNNPENCAEFCAKEHTFTVGARPWSREVWRDDCDETETDGPQQGTWEYARAGWCPGDSVTPWERDVTEAVVPGEEVEIAYGLEDFTWSGEGDQPYYYVSGNLIGYR